MRLALANSRLKDFFDIHRLAETRVFDGETMRLAVSATFMRRGIRDPGRTAARVDQRIRQRRSEECSMDGICATCQTARACRPVSDRRYARSLSLARASSRRTRDTMAAYLVERRPVEGVVGWVRCHD